VPVPDDLVSDDLDDRGELHLVDRASETLTVAGFTVYPREVEEVLADHPYVAGAAVVGVPGPAGDDVVAILVARPGTRPTQSDLDEFVTSRLPAFKRPVHYRVVDALPRKELGRIDRAAARQAYATAEGIDLTTTSAAALTAVSAAYDEAASSTTVEMTRAIRIDLLCLYRFVSNPELSPSDSCFTPTLSSIVTSRFVIGV